MSVVDAAAQQDERTLNPAYYSAAANFTTGAAAATALTGDNAPLDDGSIALGGGADPMDDLLSQYIQPVGKAHASFLLLGKPSNKAIPGTGMPPPSHPKILLL